MLSFINVSKEYHGRTILKDINVTVQRGQIALFLGSSGVGKSTLLRILNNLETIDKGSILLDNQPLDLAQVNTSHTVGMVFQHFNLFDHLTVEENITLPLQRSLKMSAIEAQKIAHTILEKYELLAKKDAYSKNLSGGQKQRVALARALALKPQIVCLDEPTSALDPLLTHHVAKTIQQLADEEYTVLVASHDTRLLSQLNCIIYLMQEGTIIESAHSQEFKKNPLNYPHIDAFVHIRHTA